MPLSLPEDLTPYTNGHEHLHASGAYALSLQRPVDLREQWHQYYDTKPPYWRDLLTASECYYVGGTGDLLSRLEDHRDNDRDDRASKRSTVLTEVCSVVGLHTAWVGESYEHATEILEPRLARWLQSSDSSWYVHTR